MSNCKFNVKISLSQNTEENMEQILKGSDSFVLPFDKIDQEAIKSGGGLLSADEKSCDYCFSSKDAAEKFVKNIKKKLKNKVEVLVQEESVTKGFSRTFKPLPEVLEERISELTPRTISGKKIGIHIINSDVLLTPENKEHSDVFRLTYVNLQCKIRNKTISQPLVLRSAAIIAKDVIKKTKGLCLDKAKDAGWKDSDIFYDMIINGVFKTETSNGKYNSKDCPEIDFATTHVKIVIADYFGEQFVGWFFYNENLDEPMNYTSYSH